MPDVVALAQRIQAETKTLQAIRSSLQSVIVGQDALLDGLLIALLADGHVLLEGLPGLAKSLAVNALARSVGGEFRRIQFTPDLLPADLVGTHVYNPKTGDWQVKEGPVFANFVLADEINRAPAKVQSALLEAMEILTPACVVARGCAGAVRRVVALHLAPRLDDGHAQPILGASYPEPR